jgi:hypothetical protein
MAPRIARWRWCGIAASTNPRWRLARSAGLLLTRMLRDRLGVMLAE